MAEFPLSAFRRRIAYPYGGLPDDDLAGRRAPLAGKRAKKLYLAHFPAKVGTGADTGMDFHRSNGRTTAPHAKSLEEQLTRALAGQTPSLLSQVPRLAVAAAHDVTVLVTGETGSGKTYLARLIHDHSPRRQHPFLVVPCGALTASLIESELFGHAKGAFTGAARAKEGKFTAAGAGTILLDEIDTLRLDQQAKLLRILETGEFESVGSNETRRCLARVIAASNRDLERAVRRGEFREDLYYRLSVMAFHLPPLRERKEDIGPLVRKLVEHFGKKFGKGTLRLRPEVLAILEEHSWPGNLRQLENVVQLAVLGCAGAELAPAHLPEQLLEVGGRVRK